MELTKRFVYDYCHKCGQATPHTVIIEQTPPYTGIIVKARCNWCGNEIEVEYEMKKCKRILWFSESSKKPTGYS